MSDLSRRTGNAVLALVVVAVFEWLAYWAVQRVLFETDLVSARFFLFGLVLAAGVAGYALLALLGLTGRDRA